jgi:hypothetical protein
MIIFNEASLKATSQLSDMFALDAIFNIPLQYPSNNSGNYAATQLIPNSQATRLKDGESKTWADNKNRFKAAYRAPSEKGYMFEDIKLDAQQLPVHTRSHSCSKSSGAIDRVSANQPLF